MAKNEYIIKDSLTGSELKELLKVVNDLFYFSQFIFVIHPIRGKVRFDLYPYQKKVLWHFLRDRFNIVLKFRQAGITELISMYCLWLAMYHSNKNIQIISIKDRVAKKVLRKMKYMYKNLPAHLQVEIVNGRSGEYGTAEEIVFANGSTITSIPTTEDAGRSEAVSLLVIDEAAIVRWASVIWAAAFPTLSTGGASIVNSTPYGVGNWFHSQWVDAISGGNDFNPIRLYWEMHPERDKAWYDQMRDSLGPRRTAQEIDGDFLTSGYSVFDLIDIKAIQDTLFDHVPIETRFNNALRIFKKPPKDKHCFIGADVATGRSRDYSSFTIMDREGEEYGCFKGKLPVDDFADLLMEYGTKYGNAILAPETNDIGLAVTTKIQSSGYRNLYYSKKLLKKKGKRKPEEELIPGWLTTLKNRPVIIDEMEEDIRNDNVIIKDPFFVEEAYTFIYDEKNKPIALGKGRKGTEEEDGQSYTDDAILGKCITNFIRKGKLKTTIVAPQ
jgi:hypothetical protein